MIVGYLGSGALSEKVVDRLSDVFEVHRSSSPGAVLSQIGRCDVIVVGGQWRGDLLAFLSSLGPVKNTIVIDQRAADPEETRVLSGKLADIGIALVDAPIHCELASDFPESSAILCGGALESIEKIRPVLEAMAPKVIYLGETGTGHTAHALVSAVGVCNRFITYECAALGFKNGLAIEDMSTVLNHSSGANSATERILPLLATGERTTDIPITDVASVLRIFSRLAMRVGAPAMLPLFVAELSQSLANQSAPGSTLDDALEILELASGVRFAQ